LYNRQQFDVIGKEYEMYLPLLLESRVYTPPCQFP